MKLLPYDEYQEKIALAIMSNAMELEPSLTEDDFHHEKHKNIFRAFSDGHFIGNAISETKYNVSMSDTLALMELTALSVFDDDKVDSLKELSGRRLGIQKAREDIDAFSDITKDVSTLGIDMGRDNYLMSPEALGEEGEKQVRTFKQVQTGLDTLDKFICSFEKGDVWVMSGRSGTKKTALSLQILAHLCNKEGTDGLFFSMEMNEGQILKRLHDMIFYEAHGVRWIENGTGDLQNECWKHFLAEKDEVGFSKRLVPRNMMFCTKSSLTIEQMRSYIKKAKKTRNISTIVIDYFQLMDGKGQDRRNIVGQNARDLKALAKDENIRIISLCQLSRAAEDGKIPVQMHHLKESGDIEEAADIITGQWTDSKMYIHMANLKVRMGGHMSSYGLMTDGLHFRDPHQAEIEEHFRND